MKACQLPCAPAGEGFHLRANEVERWIGSARDVLVRRNRLDALRVFPLIAGEAAAGGNASSMAFSRAIDDGLPLVEAVAAELGVGKASVRGLRQVGPVVAGPLWEMDPCALLKALDRMPAHRRPRSTSDWASLSSLNSHIVAAVRDQTMRRPRVALQEHLFDRLAVLDRARIEARINISLDDESFWTHLRGFVRAIEIWISAIAIKYGHNVYVAAQAEARLATEMLISQPVSEVLSLAREWDKCIASMLDGEAAELPPNWPALLAEPVPFGGLVAVSLTSEAELIAEGDALDHCAGFGYAQCCALGRTHVVSIRDGRGRSLSTAEIRIRYRNGCPTACVIQHAGPSNLDPPAQAEATLAAALRSLSDPTATNYLGGQHTVLLQMQRLTEPDHSVMLEMLAWEGISTCMAKTLTDYEGVLAWVSRRLDDEEGCYRHRNDLAEERLRDAGVADLSYEEYDERGFFDPALYFAFEDFEAELWGKDWWRTSWAETWRNRSFLDFLQWMYFE